MAQFTFEYKGWDELVQRMNQASSSQVRIILNEGLRSIGRLFVPAKGTGPLANDTPKRTGKLARSSFFVIMYEGTRQLLAVIQPAHTPEGDYYGWFVREGTGPHRILPRKAKALRFWIAGEMIFSQGVNHPGTAANKYHLRVLNRQVANIQNIVNRMGARVVAYLSGQGG